MIVAWLQLIISTATLLYLIIYTNYTAKIAKASAEQLENVLMPFLAVGIHLNRGWVLANQGFGPAINISYSIYDPRGQRNPPRYLAAIKHGDDYGPAVTDISNALNAQLPFEIEYESINGKKYRTIVTLLAGQIRTEFQRL